MKKGFTLIELLAVIVVLAILALVVTPIVLNIVENAQKGSDERSLEQYAKVLQTTYYEEKMKDPTLTLASFVSNVDTGSGVSLSYNGSKVVCSERKAVETASGVLSIELRNCTVDGRGPYNFINGSVGNKNGSFASDSWSTIIANVKKGNTSAYKGGDTKTLTLTSKDSEIAGTYTVRIANKSTPSECSTKGFSQTACGFVIEFVDIITTRRIASTGTAFVSWTSSELYQYINNNIYNAIPSEIKEGIINTFIISDYGSGSLSESTDKLYLLSTIEVKGNDNKETRQLDYYKNLGVTSENCSAAIKQYNSNDTGWWLRSSLYNGYNYIFFIVGSNCGTNVGNNDPNIGVAPAFRIG